MKEIEFRGKRIDNGKWVYGYYVKHETRQKCPIGDDKLNPDEIKHLIVFDSFADWNMPRTLQAVEVIPETVGQYTGLKDKNGKEIYEGDIVHCNARFDDAKMIVIFESGEFRMILLDRYKDHTEGAGFYTITNFEKRVIGNIHDNPELLEVEE